MTLVLRNTKVCSLPKNCFQSLSTLSYWTSRRNLPSRWDDKKVRDQFFQKSAILSPSSPDVRHFHHRPLIQLHIQHTGPHGILFEALQNVQKKRDTGSRLSGDVDVEQHFFNIPDELRRLKSGSLKWLFAVWPGIRKNYSGLATIKGTLEREMDNEEDVKTMMSKNKNLLRSAHEQQLFDALDYLKMRNIAIRRLVRLPWLLTADPGLIEESVKRVKKLLKIKEFKVAISFANMKELKLLEVASVWKREQLKEQKQEDGEEEQVFENRIEWIASQLSCPSEDVSDMMARYPNLMLIPSQNIKLILTCLVKECGVRPETIVSDPWVFTSNLKSLQSRARIIKENEIQDVKPWLFRSPQRMFEKFVQKRLEKRELLGLHKDIWGFLNEKLQCPKGTDIASEILQKVPSIKTATVIKLNEMIEFLFSAGYTAQQIRETPRILAHSVETISQRLDEMGPFNKPAPHLQLLCRTSKDYRAILRKLKNEDKMRRRKKDIDIIIQS